MLEEIKELLRRESEAILKIPASEAYAEATDLIGKKVHEDHDNHHSL